MGTRSAILVHGGAGDLEPARFSVGKAGCERAARAGQAILAAGGRALDAVEAAVRVLEDDPEFNAGTGGSLDLDGVVACDAAIMDGATLAAGAVAALIDFDRPIAVARAVLDDGEHVLLCGPGAARFARERGFQPAAPDAMVTTRARARLGIVMAKRLAPKDPGTVGAVAIDAAGHVAAATSTGGTTGKRPGRIGDTPILGAGTYADDEGGASSATGLGERIMRVTLTRVAVDAMRAGADAHAAAWRALDELVRRQGGEAGILCVDRAGRLGVALAASSMPWAAATAAAVVSGVDAPRDRPLEL